MNRSIETLKGIGKARADVLREAGIATVADLLYYFPRRYLDRTIVESTALREGTQATVIVRVESTYIAHGKRSRLVVHCQTMRNEPLHLVFFRGVGYFRQVFKKDDVLVVSGKIEYFGGLQMAHPDFEHMDEEDESALIHVGRIVPLYPTTDALRKKHLDSRGLRRLTSAVFEDAGLNVPEVVPPDLLNIHKYMGRQEALQAIHFPQSAESLESARLRLKYEELYLFNVMMVHKKETREKIPRQVRPVAFGKSREYERLLTHLPYTLTGEQLRAIEAMLAETQKDFASAVLLQGDVGSGKTVAALGAAVHYLENGLQAAMLAPTDVLARQHFRTLVDLTGLTDTIHIGLLTAAETKKSKTATLEQLASGDINFIVGTHSLIEDPVVFKNLGLLIIDEQHRFGVEQREKLRRKGKNPDLIAMTATPIPRTLCLTEFADLRIVLLKEKPAGRHPIKTMRLREDRRQAMYKSVRKHVSAGRQCFIVYPMIEESEKKDLKNATEGFEELRTSVFPDFKVDLLHGRMKNPDKERIMNDFRRGDTKILVTTTVIEVGVDVPNAAVMVIEHADRFGISQLHQLRGRVGRGAHESYCVLMADAVTEDADERLTALENSDDGFYLAEIDLKVRGPGQLLGLKQHGLADFRLADLYEDRDMVQQSFADAQEFRDINEDARSIIRSHFTEGSVVFPT